MVHNNTWTRVVIAILFLIPSLSNKANSSPKEKQITVVFRFDDYSSRSSTDFEVKLIDTFKKYNIHCTFGVIPYIVSDVHDPRPQDVVPLNQMKTTILKNAIEAGILEVALHGYSHQTIREIGDGWYTEFFGLDYNSQVEKIAKGKIYLGEILGTRIVTFIPPWNSYDFNTIHAIEKLGFKSISADKYGDASESSPIKFLPATSDLLHLRDAIKSARRISSIYSIIVVLFHVYDFLEIDREMGKLRRCQ